MMIQILKNTVQIQWCYENEAGTRVNIDPELHVTSAIRLWRVDGTVFGAAKQYGGGTKPSNFVKFDLEVNVDMSHRKRKINKWRTFFGEVLRYVAHKNDGKTRLLAIIRAYPMQNKPEHNAFTNNDRCRPTKVCSSFFMCKRVRLYSLLFAKVSSPGGWPYFTQSAKPKVVVVPANSIDCMAWVITGKTDRRYVCWCGRRDREDALGALTLLG